MNRQRWLPFLLLALSVAEPAFVSAVDVAPGDRTDILSNREIVGVLGRAQAEREALRERLARHRRTTERELRTLHAEIDAVRRYAQAISRMAAHQVEAETERFERFFVLLELAVAGLVLLLGLVLTLLVDTRRRLRQAMAPGRARPVEETGHPSATS